VAVGRASMSKQISKAPKRKVNKKPQKVKKAVNKVYNPKHKLRQRKP